MEPLPLAALAWLSLPSRDPPPPTEVGSYLIVHTPTLVCDNWSPFPVICKTEERHDFEKWWPPGAGGSKAVTCGAVRISSSC